MNLWLTVNSGLCTGEGKIEMKSQIYAAKIQIKLQVFIDFVV